MINTVPRLEFLTSLKVVSRKVPKGLRRKASLSKGILKRRTAKIFVLRLLELSLQKNGANLCLFNIGSAVYYYMEESVLLGTKPLLDSIRHFIRDPSGVFSVCHLCECHIVQ